VLKLGDREDALPGIGFHLLLSDGPEQAQVVLFQGLAVTALPELADLAVIVQDEPGQ
jgi:hypothetical protein